MNSITVKSIKLYPIAMELVEKLRTSFGEEPYKACVLVALETDDGIIGWGEASAEINPGYSYETVGTELHVLSEFLVPALLGKTIKDATEVPALLSEVRGHPLAKHALEAAVWDALAKKNNVSLADAFASHLPPEHKPRGYANVGVSIGIQPSVDATLAIITKRLNQGYGRIKLKIKPGWDVDLARGVRKVYPDITMMLDANSAYSLADAEHLKQLDDFNLLMIEQPLGYDDIYEHSKLQPQLKTPICLDESIHTADHFRLALELGACRILNLKPARVSGYTESLEIYKIAVENNVPLWIGGLLETGIGRAANLAFASLPGVTLPCDISATDRYYNPDLTEPHFALGANSRITVPTAPGIGVEVQMDRLEAAVKWWNEEKPYKHYFSLSGGLSVSNNLEDRASILAQYIKSLSEFAFYEREDKYGHMGAIITAAAFQGGIKWWVVEKRVQKVLSEENREITQTTSDFLDFIRVKNPQLFFEWGDDEKPQRALRLAEFFEGQNIQTHDELNAWLQQAGNRDRLKQIKGVGDKTADYLGLMVGLQTPAIDVRLRRFFAQAGVQTFGYDDEYQLLVQTAAMLKIGVDVLDSSIWRYFETA